MVESPKSCVKCGTDVSAAKRFRDAHGHFFCAACAEKARAHAYAHQPAPASQAQPADDTIPLAPEPDAKPHARVPGSMEFCPDCGRPMGAGRDICPDCGFNRKTGFTVGESGHGTPAQAGEAPGRARRPHKPKPCKNCGYDLTGLKTARCPECGIVSPRRRSGREMEKQTLRKMYMVPLIMIAAGVSVGTLVGLLANGNPLPFLIGYVVTVPLGFVTYFLCSLIFIGFDEPIGVTIVRLAAVFAVTSAVESVLNLIPLGYMFTWPITGIVYISLLMQIMELDIEDAWIVIVGMFVMEIVVGLAIAWIFR